jgi:hypothetical protein
MIDELKTLWQTTWDALQALEVDPTDKDCVLRYEKLCKLLLAINRQLKQLGADSEPVEIEV